LDDKMISMPDEEFRLHVVERLNAQDAAIQENTTLTKSIAEDTAFIRATWADGVAVVRFGCRLAAAWRFLLRQIVVPVGLPGVFLYALWYYGHYNAVPPWASDMYKLIKILL
jgi:hypothetical protein